MQESHSSSFSILCKAAPNARLLKNWVQIVLGFNVSASSIPDKVRTGTFPFRILEKIGIEFNLENVCFEPRSKEECLKNLRYLIKIIEKHALSYVELSEKELYDGKAADVWKLIEFIFERIYFVAAYQESQEVFAWAEKKLGVCVDDDSLSYIAHDPDLLGRLAGLVQFSQEISFENMEKLFVSNQFPLIFDSESFLTTDNYKFSYAQVYLIYQKSCDASDLKSFKNLSKESVYENNTSLEMFASPDEDDKNSDGASLAKDKYLDKPHHLLKEFDLAVCFLQIPRILQIYEPERLLRIIVLLNEDQIKNRYSIEVNEIESFSNLVKFDVDKIEELVVDGSSCDIFLCNNHLKLIFKSECECEQYSRALSIVYAALNN